MPEVAFKVNSRQFVIAQRLQKRIVWALFQASMFLKKNQVSSNDDLTEQNFAPPDRICLESGGLSVGLPAVVVTWCDQC